MALLGLVGIGACQSPPSDLPGPTIQDLRAIVDAAIAPVMDEFDVPGVAVGIALDGQSVVFSYGVASREAGTPVDDGTLFELGSVSKVFAATLAGYAEAHGAISLDDHPGDHIPALRGSSIDRATLLHLGTYTAGGLPLQFPEGIEGHEGMLRYFQGWRAVGPPGTERRYSNPSVGLFGHVIGIALEEDFTKAMETRLLPELGLHETFLRVPGSAKTSYAWGYDRENMPTRVRPGIFAAEAYGIRSTAADMLRFVQMNIDPEWLPDPVRRAVEGTQVGYFRVGEMVQGLGWEQYVFPIPLDRLLEGNSSSMIMESHAVAPVTRPPAASEAVLFSKTGSTNGFGAYVAFVPRQRIGMVILANRNVPIPARIRAAYEILEQLTVLDR